MIYNVHGILGEREGERAIRAIEITLNLPYLYGRMATINANTAHAVKELPSAAAPVRAPTLALLTTTLNKKRPSPVAGVGTATQSQGTGQGGGRHRGPIADRKMRLP
jgi:hypothetical protein